MSSEKDLPIGYDELSEKQKSVWALANALISGKKLDGEARTEQESKVLAKAVSEELFGLSEAEFKDFAEHLNSLGLQDLNKQLLACKQPTIESMPQKGLLHDGNLPAPKLYEGFSRDVRIVWRAAKSFEQNTQLMEKMPQENKAAAKELSGQIKALSDADFKIFAKYLEKNSKLPALLGACGQIKMEKQLMKKEKAKSTGQKFSELKAKAKKAASGAFRSTNKSKSNAYGKNAGPKPSGRQTGDSWV